MCVCAPIHRNLWRKIRRKRRRRISESDQKFRNLNNLDKTKILEDNLAKRFEYGNSLFLKFTYCMYDFHALQFDHLNTGFYKAGCEQGDLISMR